MLSDFKAQLISSIEESIPQLSPEQSQAHPPAVTLEVPSDKRFGDYSCTVAMRLAGLLKKNPLDIAQAIKENLLSQNKLHSLQDKIKSIEVVKPGFINFYLTPRAFWDVLSQVAAEGKDYGRSQLGQGRKVQIEFVSANPTGPLSVAHARQAAVGDALGNILSFLGYDAKKEYYVNDEGNQINILGRSLQLRGLEILGEQVEFPEDCYQGDYIRDLAAIFFRERGIQNPQQLKEIELPAFSRFAVDHLLAIIKKELDDFGVHFDVWSHQSEIATSGNIEKVIAELRQKGFIYDHEGAVWFKSTALGDDKDRVVKKSDGNFTYLTPDIVYHKNKFERGFFKVINIWGPDHHGYIPRIQAAVEALGNDRKALDVLIVQLATIFRNGKPLSMSTRRGQYISLREVLDEVGRDAARFFFLMRHIEAHLEFDLELAKKETPENPVYYIQYAHARIHSILAVAEQTQLRPRQSGFELLKEDEELALLKKIGQFSEALAACHDQLDPYPLTSYLLELATGFHKFYDRHRVADTAQPELSSQRLSLINAARVVLSNGLGLLGVQAPQKM